MSERQEDIPRVFRDFFEDSGILDSHLKSRESWSDLIRRRVEELDYRVVAWNEVGEGAIAAVLANKYCVDPVAIVVGGPADIKQGQEQEELPRHWSVIWQGLDIFPSLVGYCEWGTMLSNYNSRDLERFSSWIKNAEDFISHLREQGRKEWLSSL